MTETIAPLKLAQQWDNVGLLVGSERRQVRRVLLTIDVTREVVAEARAAKTDLIISYHPVIWDGLRQIRPDGPGAVVFELIRSGIAVFSIHTALDAAVGGVNDGLAEILGIEHAEPLGDYVEPADGDRYKLVVFVPADAVDKVAEAVFSAGAGQIGNYSKCSFRSEGTGGFFAEKGASPTVGRKGRLEEVPEVRFETVVPAAQLAECVSAMKKAHPYETPAFDCYRLGGVERFGLGRIGKLAEPLSVEQVLERVRKHTGAGAVGIVGGRPRRVRIAAVCAGSCGKLINAVIAAGADLYLTGELKHHHALAARQAGLTCICLGHSVSERFILRKLARELRNRLKNVSIRISKKDRDPFEWKQL